MQPWYVLAGCTAHLGQPAGCGLFSGSSVLHTSLSPMQSASASAVQVIGLAAAPTAPADILHWQKTLPGAPWSYLALVVLAYCTYEQASFVAARCAGEAAEQDRCTGATGWRCCTFQQDSVTTVKCTGWYTFEEHLVCASPSQCHLQHRPIFEQAKMQHKGPTVAGGIPPPEVLTCTPQHAVLLAAGGVADGSLCQGPSMRCHCLDASSTWC